MTSDGQAANTTASAAKSERGILTCFSHGGRAEPAALLPETLFPVFRDRPSADSANYRARSDDGESPIRHSHREDLRAVPISNPASAAYAIRKCDTAGALDPAL